MEIQTAAEQQPEPARGSAMGVNRSPGARIDTDFDALIRHHAVTPVFQPIVTLGTGQIVGYEALARGPTGSPFATPEALFRHGVRLGRLDELDWVCRAAACRDALAAGLPFEVPLFINVEPSTLRTLPPAHVIPILRAASGRLQVVVEITERSLASDPAALLASILRLRERSMRIALDDVGADKTSLALMPLLSPDVIKLDRSIIQGRVTSAVSSVVNAVLAEAERTGAAILAEGIESPNHLAVAASMGATLGQGWLFGRPGELPQTFHPSDVVLPQVTVPTGSASTPFEVVGKHRPVNHTTKEMLERLSMHLENKCLHLAEPAVLLATFQDVRYFTGTIRRRYSRFAARGVFTAAYARGMPPVPAAGIRGSPLSPDDPLTSEWIVIVLGTHFAGGLFASDRGSRGEECQRAFDYVVTYDRELIIEAAQPLLQRLLPTEPDTYW